MNIKRQNANPFLHFYLSNILPALQIHGSNWLLTTWKHILIQTLEITTMTFPSFLAADPHLHQISVFTLVSNLKPVKIGLSVLK